MIKLKGVGQLISIEYKMAQVKLCLEPEISLCKQSKISSVFSYVSEQVSDVALSEKFGLSLQLQIGIGSVCNLDAVEGHCFQAMKIVHHHVNGYFDWLVSVSSVVS